MRDPMRAVHGSGHGGHTARPLVATGAVSPLLKPYVALVIGAGGALILYSAYQLPDVPYPLGWIALAILCVVASMFPVQVPGVPVYFSISDTFFITSALLFGPAPATISIAVDS